MKTVQEELRELVQRELVKKIKSDLLKLAKQRVPRDTGALEEQGITAEVVIKTDSIEITFFIKKTVLSTGIDANYLALILDIGVSKKGLKLKRSQSKPMNPKGSPTQGWWSDFEKDAQIYIDNLSF